MGIKHTVKTYMVKMLLTKLKIAFITASGRANALTKTPLLLNNNRATPNGPTTRCLCSPATDVVNNSWLGKRES